MNGNLRVVPILVVLMLLISSLSLCSIAHAESKNVSFDLNFTYIKATYVASINVPDGTVEPNKSTAVGIYISGDKMTILLENIPYVSGSASMEIDPLKNESYPVPNLYWEFLGVKLGLKLTFKGVIEGQLRVEGNGTLNKNSLEWSSPGTQSVTLNTTVEAKEGDFIKVFLDDIKYTIYIGVKAVGDVPGFGHKEESLINYTRLGSILGSPSSVSGTYKVGYFVSLGFLPWVGVIGLGSATGFVGYLYFKTRRKLKNIRQKMAGLKKTEVICSSCKTTNAPGAKFCRNCGKPL